MKILIVGDSEAASYNGAHILAAEFGLEEISNAEGGRRIMDNLVAVKKS